MSTDPPSASYGPPMAHVGVDLFEFSGKQYLICVDKWSGFPVYKQLNTVTTRAVIGILEEWFNILGWPSTIRSDGGPQFLGPLKPGVKTITLYMNCLPPIIHVVTA